MTSPRRLSLGAARRLALAAQGLLGRPARADLAAVRAVFDHVHVVQIDSVNVVCRSQELPLWARLGDHPRDALPRLVAGQQLFEYWAHEASLVPVHLHPHLRWRMEAARTEGWASLRRFHRRARAYVDEVRTEVHRTGGLAASALPGGKKKASAWWGWDDRKKGLALLFWLGEVSAVRRAGTFERVYVPPAVVVPAAILAAPTPAPAEAQRTLLLAAAAALGVATAGDLADYFRLRMPRARPLLAGLVAEGALVEVAVDGWREPAYVPAGLEPPARTTPGRRALLSPFDSLVWARPRTERLWGFRYRLELYTPADRRVFGYYVLPFLLGDRLVARVDLKADRDAGVLRVHAAYAEPGAGAVATITRALAAELTAMATWLGLTGVDVGPGGDLSRPLRRALAPARRRARA
mgnify:CR=1 FL=1